MNRRRFLLSTVAALALPKPPLPSDEIIGAVKFMGHDTCNAITLYPGVDAILEVGPGEHTWTLRYEDPVVESRRG